jgi:hypothetical protein
MLAAVAACAIAVVAGSPDASATTITFGTFTGTYYESLGTTYSESGFSFTNDVELDRWENGSAYDSDPTPSTGLFTNFNYSTTVLTQIGGGAFDLLSIDVDDVYHQGSPSGLLNYAYGFAGGGGGTGSFLVDDVPGFSTILLNLANLAYFSFTPSTELRWVQFDNVQVAGSVVPIPATLPLFASALAALGWVARRRKRAEGSPLPLAA